MTDSEDRSFSIRRTEERDLPDARALMIRTFDQDFGYGYRPDWHADVDDLAGWYMRDPRTVMYVAVDDRTGEIVGTAGVRSGRLKMGTTVVYEDPGGSAVFFEMPVPAGAPAGTVADR